MRQRNYVAAIVLGLASLPGGRAWGDEDHELQVARVTREIEEQPRNAGLYLRRGEIHRHQANWAAAQADYAQAARLDPALPGVDLAYGRLWLEAGDPKRSRAALDRFLARCPENPEGWLERARARAHLGDRREAVADYTRALALFSEPRPEHYLERSRVLVEDGRREEALRGLDEGIRKLGPLVTLQLSAIDLELEDKRYDAALARVETLSRQAERKESWLARRGEILVQAGRREEAKEAFGRALEAIHALPAGRRGGRAVTELERRVREALKGCDGGR